MKTRYLVFILSMFLLGCQHQDDEPQKEITDLLTTLKYKQVEGVDDNLLSLDIYYKSSTDEKKPVVIYVHGGGWCIGDKAQQIENKVNLFKSLNYVFVSINYRLSSFPFELNNASRVQFPVHNNDVADAIKWVVNNIREYGGDASKIALIGHSAGAHLVTLTGTNSSFLNAVGLTLSDIKGIAAIDTEGYDVLSEVQGNNNLYINAFGTNSTLNRQASPIFNITNNAEHPQFFIAKRGNANRIKIANDFIQALEQKGVLVSQVDGSIYTHKEINEAIGMQDETLITIALTNFLKSVFQ